MNKILVDSDALFGFYNFRDPHHAHAKKIYRKLQQKQIQLFITNLVVYETATLFSYRISHQEAVNFIKEIYSLNFTHIFINEQLSEKTFTLFLCQTKRRTSFIDCANVIVMKEFKIDKIFSFDAFYKDKLLK